MLRSLFTALCLLLFVFSSTAQEWETSLQNNQLLVHLSEGSGISGNAAPSVQLLTEDGPRSLLSDMGLIMGGLDPAGNLHSWDVLADGEGGILDEEANLNSFWRVTGADVQAHRDDFADNGVIDNPLPAIYAWPGRANPFFEDYNDEGLSLPNTLQSLAQFWDADGDGVYNPENGDFPSLFVRGCQDVAIVPTEMVWTPTKLSSSLGGIEIGLTAFRLSCEEDEASPNQTIFFHHRIVNRRLEALNDFHFGYYVDGDIGCPADDYLGFFPLRYAAYFYNANNTDAVCAESGTSFGDNPPLVAVDLLRGPLDTEANELLLHSAMPSYGATSGNFPAATTEYTSPQEAYQYLQGAWRDGSPLVDQGIGYGMGEETNFAFPGDPQTGSGWTEAGEGNPAGDRRAFLSYASNVLLPGAVNEVIIALSFQYDDTTSPLEQIDDLREQVDQAQALFDGCFSLDFLPYACTERLTDLDDDTTFSQLQWSVAPNPAGEQTIVSFQGASDGLIRVFNATGQLQGRYAVQGEQLILSTEHWPAGIYFLQWEQAKRTDVKKLLVKK